MKFVKIKKNGKRAVEPWKEKTYGSIEDIDTSKYNVAFIAGKEANIIVVDFDIKKHPEVIEFYKKYEGCTKTIETPNGIHLYFQYEEGFKNVNGLKTGIDVKTNNGLVVIPPSTGIAIDTNELKEYREVGNMGINKIPDTLKEELIKFGYMNKNEYAKKVLEAPEGTRNDTYNKQVFKAGINGEPEGVIKQIKEAAAIVGLNDIEVKNTFNSAITAAIAKTDTKKRYTVEDIKEFLNEVGYRFYRDTLTDDIYCRYEGNSVKIDDFFINEIFYICDIAGFPNRQKVETAFKKIANDNSFNSAISLIESFEFIDDMVFEEIYQNIELAEGFDKDVFITIFRKFLIGAINKIYHGTQNVTLVLDGAQGIGKSWFCKWLAPSRDFYHTGAIRPGQKDEKIRLTKTILWELAELGSTVRKSDIEELKDFLTTESVSERAPYGKVSIKRPAITSFIGTVNNEAGFLNDNTGNRRFFCFEFKKINMEKISKLDPQNLWSWAYREWKKDNNSWILTKEEEDIKKEYNGKFKVVYSIQDYLELLFEVTQNEDDFITSYNVIEEFKNTFSNYHAGSDMKLFKEVSNGLAAMGAKMKSKKINGKTIRGYLFLKLKR